MRSIPSTLARKLGGCLLAACCGAAGAQGLAPAEVEARNAAAGFMFSSLATLGMLREECEGLTGPGPEGAAAIARGWWERNQPEIEAAYVWTDRYLDALRRNDPAAHQKVSRALGDGTADAVQRNAAQLFRGQLPTAASCAETLRLYATPQQDVRQLGQATGQEKFAAFAQALQRIRAEPGYQLPAHLRLDPERSLRYGLVASLQAAQAALQRRDAPAVQAAYESLAARGDAKAAQSLGAMYLRGDLVPRNDAQAYRWFYKAWLLRDAEGVNALGVMHRDGRAGPADARLALALFQLAQMQATEPRTRTRAQRNLQALAATLTPAQRTATACLTLNEVAAAVERPLPEGERGSSKLFDPDGHKRLGDVWPAMTGGIPLFCG